MKKGIIFDLDGTLWDSSAQVIPAWNRVLSRNNCRNITEADMAGFMGKTGEDIALAMMPDFEEEKAFRIFDECCREEQSFLRENGGVLYPMVEETLKKLGRNYELAIVSNCHPDYIEAFFYAHGLKAYFSDYECHGNTGLSKGENIKLVVERNRFDKAVYVGDTSLDSKSAEQAGIPFIFAAYGFGELTNTDYQINSFSQLSEYVTKILE